MVLAMAARALALCVALCVSAEAWISRGPNSCANLALSETTPLARSFCCRGWTSAGESRLCVKPICKSDCGAGACVSPNRCGCSDGTLRVSCVDGSSGIPGSELTHGHSIRVAHERAAAGEHSDRKVARRDPGTADVATDGAAAACSRGAPCDGAQAQQAARVQVSSEWPPCAGANCPRMQLDSGDSVDAVGESGREGAECDATPCHRRPASAQQPASFGMPAASSAGSAGAGDVARNEGDEKQDNTFDEYSDDDRLTYYDDSDGGGRGASRALAERPLYPRRQSSRFASSADNASNASNEDGVVAASTKQVVENGRWSADNAGWVPDADRGGSSSAIITNPLDHNYRGIAGARSATASFSTAVKDRSDASLQYVEGRANGVYVRARMAAPYELDDRGGVAQRMSADSATVSEQSRQPPRPPRVATGSLHRQPLVLVDGGGADANGNGLPVIVGPVFAAAKPAFPFAAASKPEPAGGRSSSAGGVAVAGGVRTEDAVAASSGPCSREHPALAAASHGAPAMPCGGTSDGVPQLATPTESGGQSPCSAHRCTSCTTCDEASAAAAAAAAAGSHATRTRHAYRAPQQSELCSPGFVAVSEGDLIVCERIAREQVVASPCNGGSSSPCASAVQEASCDNCPPGVDVDDPDVDSAVSSTAVNRRIGVSIEGRRPVDAISGELLPVMPATGGCGSSLDSGCLSPAASEQHVTCGRGVNVGGSCGVASSGVGSSSSSSSAARTPGVGGDSRNGCWLAARLGIADRNCRRGEQPALPTTPNPNCVHGTLSRRDGMCECNAGFWGERCDKDFDECDAGLHDCAFGCVNTFGSYKCVCAPGSLPSDGNDCYVRPCPSCLHGGQCFDGRCQCLPGFRGAQCEEDIDECHDGRNLCSQLCRNTFGSHVCLCRPGFRMLSDNRTCEEKTCKNPCLNGGECVRSKCICADGFIGVACQFEEKKMVKKFVHRR